MGDHSFPVPVQDLHGDDLCFRRHTAEGSAAGLSAAGGDARYMSSVAIIVIGSGSAVYGVIPADDTVFKVWVAADATVQDGDTAAFSQNSLLVDGICFYNFSDMVHVPYPVP